MVVHFKFFFSPQSCFAQFWARSKSSKYLQQKNGIMAVKRKTIHNLVWQKLVPTNRRDINKFPQICLRKYFRLIGATYLYASIYGMHFHYITYSAMSQHKNSCPGGHEIYNFGGLFLEHYHYTLSLSDLCLGVKKKIFKE